MDIRPSLRRGRRQGHRQPDTQGEERTLHELLMKAQDPFLTHAHYKYLNRSQGEAASPHRRDS